MNVSSKLTKLTQPYPGLRTYLQHESELFFGRSEQINKMLGRLEENHFLAVVGGSGSGKSSLVRAGLLPVLKQGYLLGAGVDWIFIVMKPGGDPFTNLATELYHTLADDQCSFDASDIAFTQAELQTSHLGLLEVIEQIGIEKGRPLLLLVDQFEEIFRFQRGQGSLHSKDRDHTTHKVRNEATAFVNLLLTTVEQAAKMDLPIYVLLTMRSDFIGACDFFPGLSQAISDSQFLVPRLTRKQMKVVIEKTYPAIWWPYRT
ncbi:AAA family ATPase [Candidatus Colwellia aromaticivorans]|uniref:nSTAND1 domain-containing NTPase n=1 Tax=Candidatus Colwellia aromaticivorans TaxID=2267621 RepID=UPI000DF20AD1|nr:AAA family ATPase [Candidatus Colwellia aromaticivorans]